ncbi:MAG: nucleoside kinase, partial [Kiritimatiellaeota bacterium]|nr:nucleoside kinase [Kiritimatiellota bacterium]
AAHELFPSLECRTRNSVGSGLYCTVAWPDLSENALAENVARLKAAIQEMVRQDLPITYEIATYEAAVSRFRDARQTDKLNLLAHRNPPAISLTCCGDYRDISQTVLVPRTGLLKCFDLVPRAGGFVLNVPSSANPDVPPPLPPGEQLFEVYREHIEWGRIVGVTTAGQLNQSILEKRATDFVQTIEALHSKKLASIADRITRGNSSVRAFERSKISAEEQPDNFRTSELQNVRTSGIRLVLIAGPSSAGKTTTAKRLITHLRVNGYRPILISTDNYFVGDELNPRDKDGNLDYEHIEAMDLPRLNSDLLRLMNGEAVRMRSFSFKTKQGFDEPDETRLPPNGIIVMEGIHCLNPQMSADIPKELKFFIYVNTLTQLGIDSSNRISTADTRIIRRMVRDHQFRNRSAVDTLRLWKFVIRGERRWIYPYQHLADAVFNSALDYELAVLKPLATLLLNQIKPWHEEYIEARRLSGILHNFSALSADAVPGDSILRESIGNSQLEY